MAVDRGALVIGDISGYTGYVIMVHSLLKNHVIEAHGVEAYAFLTDPLLAESGLALADGIPHVEHYDDVGDIGGRVLDLERRWTETGSTRAAYLARNDAAVVLDYHLDTPPGVVRDYLTDPRKRMLWTKGVKRIDREDPTARWASGARTMRARRRCDARGDLGLGAVRLVHVDVEIAARRDADDVRVRTGLRRCRYPRLVAHGHGEHSVEAVAAIDGAGFRKSIGAGMATIDRLANE